MSNILTGQKDWLIFPEGLMVKGKKIVKEDDGSYSVIIDNMVKRVFTGAAYFGLNSQLLREDYINNRINNKKRFSSKYLLENIEDINKNETMIIPINISYSPIRTGSNFIVDIAKKVIDKLSNNLLEEIEIEGNIILKSKMIIQILKPISLQNITSKVHIIKNNKNSTKIHNHNNHNKIINKYRRVLTNDFMKNIYEHTTIRFDHIFILIIYFTNKDIIDKNYFKRLIYLIAKEIKKSNIIYDQDIDTDIIKLISYEDFQSFNDVLNLAIKDSIIIETNESYIINKSNLLDEYTHNTIRLKNILKVILNEVLIIDNIVNLVKSYIKLGRINIEFILQNQLITEERDEFNNDYKIYNQKDILKDKSIGSPYFLDTTNFKTVVISIHGFSSAPKEVEELGIYLNENHINIYAPRLKGHGTTSNNLENTTWKDWYVSISKAIALASIKYENIYILGFSAGGLLALLHSYKQCDKIKGIICINTALKLNDKRANFLIPVINLWNNINTYFNIKVLKKEYINNYAEHPNINYNKHYIKSINQLNKLIDTTQKKLSKVNKPTLIIQGKNDPVVDSSSAKIIYENIKSKYKDILYLKSNKHVIIKTNQNKIIFQKIIRFINKTLD